MRVTCGNVSRLILVGRSLELVAALAALAFGIALLMGVESGGA
jgi:hypothetical protein